MACSGIAQARVVAPSETSVAVARVTTRGAVRARAEGEKRIIELPAVDITYENFERFGQLVGWIEDMVPFGDTSAQLVLDQGTPRFYIMRLRDKPLAFDRITFHAKTTQSLGCLGDQPWYMAVADATFDLSKPPAPEDLMVFRIPPGVFVNMKQGTWHAGPFFEPSYMDFYNLELSDTNVVDHNTHVYSSKDGLSFQVTLRASPAAGLIEDIRYIEDYVMRALMAEGRQSLMFCDLYEEMDMKHLGIMTFSMVLRRMAQDDRRFVVTKGIDLANRACIQLRQPGVTYYE
ncbi:unnamed protein product [Pedinophyceae sp. YPF-701]|nr:unnamed protein product [Pedinophyceae sp. YPF-701]